MTDNIYFVRRRLSQCCISGNFSEAILISNDILNYYASINDVSSDAYAEDLFNIAIAYENVFEHKKAIRMYTESSRVIMASHGENVEFFYRLMNIAVTYCKTGEYTVALDLFDSIISGLKRKKITDASIKSLCYYNIGSAYCSLEKFNEGINFFKKARRYAGSVDSSHLFDVLYSIGIAYMSISEYRKSSLFFAEASKVLRDAEPQNISELVNVLMSDAEALEKMGAYNKSITKLSEVLQMMDNMIAKGNRNYTIIQTRIAALYVKSGNYTKAIKICEEIVENTKNLVGENSLQYANALRDMALLCKDTGDFEIGSDCLKKGLAVKSTILGAENHETIRDTISLIGLYIEMRDLKSALDLLIQTINIMDENENNLDEFMSKLAELYLSLGEYGNLHNAHSRAIELYKPQNLDY